MTEITLRVKEGLLAALRRSPDEFARELRLVAAIHQYERREVLQEKAAEIAGLDRTDFLLKLARRSENTSALDLADLEKELQRG